MLQILTQGNGGSIEGINNRYLQIRDNLKTIHNDQLVYLYRQDIALILLSRFKIWLVHFCQTEEDTENIVPVLLFYDACILLISVMSRTVINLRSIPGGW